MSTPVHLRIVSVAAHAAAAMASGLDWLSADESARAAAISAPLRRAQFLAGHWLARQMLARVHGGDEPRDWVLSAGVDGPPQVSHRNGAPMPPGGGCVALTHSAGWLACAVSDTPVGLDLEVPRPRRNLLALAQEVCTPRERQRLAGLPVASHLAHFYAMWTLKEAWLKRQGEGVSFGRLRCLETDDCPGPRGEARLWQVDDFTMALVAPQAVVILAQCEGIGLPAPQTWGMRDLG